MPGPPLPSAAGTEAAAEAEAEVRAPWTVVTGGNGFLGRMLVARLREAGRPVRAVDVAPEWGGPEGAAAPDEYREADLRTPEGWAAVFGDGHVEVVFHLAGVMSGQAEAEYALGMAVNLAGVLHALREMASRGGALVRFVFTSSVAVFGSGLPTDSNGVAHVPANARIAPESSYGTQKAAAELLLLDAARRGLCDARIGRLPTVVVRGGAPNAATSSFASSIVREPAQGRRAVLPVRDDLPLWVCSPERAAANLLAFSDLASSDLAGGARCINLPGLMTTPRAMIAALEAARPGAQALIDRAEDARISAIVGSWPGYMECAKALELGLRANASTEEIVAEFLAALVADDTGV